MITFQILDLCSYGQLLSLLLVSYICCNEKDLQEAVHDEIMDVFGKDGKVRLIFAEIHKLLREKGVRLRHR